MYVNLCSVCVSGSCLMQARLLLDIREDASPAAINEEPGPSSCAKMRETEAAFRQTEPVSLSLLICRIYSLLIKVPVAEVLDQSQCIC